MNNVDIVESNGIKSNVTLISYFNNNNKNYIFYTKNETVQGGLIKIYVASQNNGNVEIINDDEWSNLKKIMQSIIMGNSSVSYLKYNGVLSFNESKAIALKEDNINTIKNVYNNAVGSAEQSGGTNKDLLTESFGSNMSQTVNPQEPAQQVQLSSIPNVQNNFNMEATPVNLSTDIPVEPVNPVEEVAPFQSTPIIEPISSTNPIENVSSSPEVSLPETPLSINNIVPPEVDSGFKVSDAPNIFDQPINFGGITQEEINKPNISESSVNDSSISSVESISNDSVPTSASNDMRIDIDAQISLNERKIKLFEELANIYKEENKLLKGNNSENTASDLFNNNGSLNEAKVLDN